MRATGGADVYDVLYGVRIGSWLYLMAVVFVSSAHADAMKMEDFADYVWGRAGDGELVYRVSTGKAYDTVTGDVVASLEGLEVAMAVPSRGEPGTVYHVGRAMLLYRHPQTNAFMFAYPGSDPETLTSVSAYSFVDGEFRWRLGNALSDAPPRTMPGSVDCDRQGRVLFCTRSSAYAADEGTTVLEYRWTVDRAATSMEAAARVEFAETEPPPEKGISDNPVLIRLSSYRLADWDALPGTIREWVESEASTFGTLPTDIQAFIGAAGFEP